MASLIPNASFEDFKRIISMGKLNDLQSCEVNNENGKYLFTAIISHGDVIAADFARIQAEYLALRSNIVGGLPPETILAEFKTDKYPHLTKAREVLKAKRETVTA